MAKVSHEKPLDRRVVVKTRGFLVHKNYKGKRPYVQKWPKRRGPTKKPQVKVWIEHFSKWAHWSKQPDPCAVSTAKDLSPTTGYWSRDIIHRAGVGKINHHRPNVPLSSPLPWLFLHPPSKRYEGPPRVITPTMKLTQAANMTGTLGVFVNVIPTTKVWDNNAFWDPASHPERYTFRADGLYLITVELSAYSGSAAEFFVEIRDKLGVRIASGHDTMSANLPGAININLVHYFYAGEWFDIRLAAGITGAHYRLNFVTIMAITPETVI